LRTTGDDERFVRLGDTPHRAEQRDEHDESDDDDNGDDDS
jgi:hypothetical protein